MVVGARAAWDPASKGSKKPAVTKPAKTAQQVAEDKRVAHEKREWKKDQAAGGRKTRKSNAAFAKPWKDTGKRMGKMFK